MQLNFNIKNWFVFISLISFSFSICQGITYQFQETLNFKSWRDNIESLFGLLIISTITFIFGNYNNTFPNFISIFLLIITPIIWSIFHHSDYNLNNIQQWTNNTYLLYLSIILPISIFTLLHLKHAFHNKNYYYLFSFIFILIIIITLIYTSFNIQDTERQLFHLHHWMIGWLFSFFTRFDLFFSHFAAGIAIGTFIHSFSIYNDNFQLYDCITKCNNKICSYNSCEINSYYDFYDSNWYIFLILSSIFLILGIIYKDKI